jgi:hypothetical protein
MRVPNKINEATILNHGKKVCLTYSHTLQFAAQAMPEQEEVP